MQERERILKMLEDGTITADEAARLLEALGEGGPRFGPPFAKDFGERIARKVELSLKNVPHIVESAVSSCAGFIGTGEEREFVFKPKKNLVVKTVSGDIKLTGDDDADIRIKLKNGHKVRETDDELMLKTMTGDLDMKVNRKQKVVLKAASGDIHIKNLESELSSRCGSGDVDAKDVKGLIAMATGSGDIHMEDVSGTVAVSIGSGDAQVSELSGELTLSLGSGDADLDFADCKGGKIKVGSGDIDIALPDKSDIELTVHIPRDCNLSSDFEMKKSKELPSERMDEYKVEIGKPKAKLFVRTRSGDISITKRKKK
ncbi:DUF4097 family beta strand repeat protein [candidate division WOR-3 bacterium]|nr:DUF4097 family beta strand repeat protein [candidate division WOR-3 bacterium]